MVTNVLIRLEKACVDDTVTWALQYAKNPDVLHPRRTVTRHLAEVQDKKGESHKWIQKISGYSHEQLSNLPESIMKEGKLKLATEYHLWKAGWYHVRFLTLKKAAERTQRIDDEYPSPYRCKAVASDAYKLSNDHRGKYLQCYKALSRKAKRNIMNEIQFPSFMDSQEYNHEYSENEPCVDLAWRNHANAESVILLDVKIKLNHLINCMLRRKRSLNWNHVKSVDSIRKLLAPTGMKLNEDMITKLTMHFSVEDLSQPPRKSFRRDREFSEVAWLFNQYRSLWHRKRCHEFMKALPHWQEGKFGIGFTRLDEAIRVEKKAFKQYDSLSKDYYELLKKYHPDIIVNAQNSPYMDSDRQINTPEVEGHEQVQWRGKRKRTTLNRARKSISQAMGGTLDASSVEVFDNVGSDAPALNGLHASKMVHVEGNCPTGDDRGHRAKRYKSQGFTSERTPLGTVGVAEVERHKITPEVFYEPQKEIPYDFGFLDDFFQKDSASFLRNCDFDNLIEYNEHLNPASSRMAEHHQPDFSLQNEEKHPSQFDRRLEEQTPASSAVNEMMNLGEAGAGTIQIEGSTKMENANAGKWHKKPECITKTAAHGQKT